MIYLSGFRFPGAAQEANYMANSWRAKQTCYDSYYPFGLFEGRTLPELDLLEITILYGGNGSGNKVAYRTPSLGGLTVEGSVSMHERATGTNNKNGYDLAANWESGPLALGADGEEARRLALRHQPRGSAALVWPFFRLCSRVRFSDRP